MNPDPTQFTLELAGRATADLERLTRRANQPALRMLLLEVLRQILDNLRGRPREWGDPYHNYHELNAVGYGKTITAARLRIVYAVHDTRPIVWLTAVIPLAGSPFLGE